MTRRRLFGAIGTLGVLATASPLNGFSKASVARPKKSKRKTLTFTNTSQITFPDSGPSNAWPNAITVSGFKRGKVTAVTLMLMSISHGFPADIDIILQAPNGRKAKVWSDAGGLFPLSPRTITLDDAATDDLPNAGFGAGDRYRPMNYSGADDNFNAIGGPGDTTNVALATFKGDNPNGVWTLWAADDASGDGGSIANGWGLTITAKVKR